MHLVYTDSAGIEIIQSQRKTNVWVSFKKINNRPDYDKIAYVIDSTIIDRYKDSNRRHLIITEHLTLHVNNQTMKLPK